MSDSMGFVRAVLLPVAVVALVGAACGSATEGSTSVAAETAAESQTESTDEPASTTTEEPTTTTAAPATTSTEAPLMSAGPVPLVPGPPLTPGATYQTTTDVPFTFTIPESEAGWMAVAQNAWSATVIIESDSMTSDDGAEPGFNLAAAEMGATRESVAAAMIESQPRLGYTQSEGLFEGQETIILEGAHEPEVSGQAPVFTGEDSFFTVLMYEQRVYTSQIFEAGGRVIVVSYDCHPDDVALVLAEIAPLLESLEIGVEA